MQRLPRLTTLTCLLLPVHSAIAQSADDPDQDVTRLAPVVVTTEQAAGPVPGYVASQSGTASKTGAQGKTPTGLPKHTASLWADVTLADFLPGLGFGLGAHYVGSTYADTANTLKVPSVTLVDAAIRYEFGRANPVLDGLQLAVHVGNLFDKHYYSSCAGLSCSEGFARTVQATVSYRW